MAQKPINLVLLEDNADDAELIVDQLRKAGYELHWKRVHDASGFVESLKSQPDVILADYNLPGFDALQALRLLKERGVDIPFLIVSGAIGEDVAVNAMREGAADYLLKDRLARLGPAVARAIAVKMDREQRKKAESALRESEQRFRRVFEEGAVGIAIISRELRIEDVNETFSRLVGSARDRMIGRSFIDFVHPDDAAKAADHIRRAFAGEPAGGGHEQRLVTEDGGVVWVQVNASVVRDDEHRPLYAIVVIQDVSERRRVERELQYRALHDALTDLPNRTLLADRLRRAILTAQRDSRSTAILLMDLDGFKKVNDSLGHSAGDQVLRELARRLKEATRESDTVARLGGDEFAVIPGQAIDLTGIEASARRVLGVFTEPFKLGEVAFQLSASLGIAVYPEHGRDEATLMRHADAAMYTAKRAQTGFAIYSPGAESAISIRAAVITDLADAISKGQLVLHYQPQVDMRTGVTKSFEALVRWAHPKRGLLGPDDFIPIAEQTEVIGRLTRWVLDNAMAQAEQWADAGIQLSVAVNVTVADLHDASLPEVIGSLLKKHKLSPDSLTLEITERAIIVAPAHTTLRALGDLGVHISIDDFGTGYSALAYLRTIPVNEIKIDRSFVTRMASNEDDATIARTIVDLGHSLRLRVLAEGVETARSWTLLASFGCDYAQGQHIGPPMPAAAVPQWLQDANAQISTRNAARTS